MTKVGKKTEAVVRKVGDKAVTLQETSTKHVNKYLTRRVKRTVGVRRFVVGWVGLVTLLCLLGIVNLWQISTKASRVVPADGGVYTEGMLGSSRNLNPLFGSGSVDSSAGRLIFSSLFRYDQSGQLTGDLAADMKVGEDKKSYVVTLRDDVRWHDGEPLTAADVAHTVQVIQNPETRASLYASWKDVKVTAQSDTEVLFELPAPFAPFPDALTLQILPAHLLKDVPPSQLRTASFNSTPVGSGPFIFQALRSGNEGQQLEFTKNEAYYRGAPRLDKFILRTFANDQELYQALREREITAAVDLKHATLETLKQDQSVRSVDLTLSSGVFAFFKTTSPLLSQAEVRNALVQAYDRQYILDTFDARYLPIKSSLLPTQLGFDARHSQVTDRAEAERLLDSAGWVKQADGSRVKDGQPLELSLVTVNNAQYTALAENLQKQWAKVGVRVKIDLLGPEQLQQNALAAHAYDVLLYQIPLGHDPDQYVYWHSSQARAGGLNFSEWKSPRADVSLDVARTRLEDVLRIARYQTFQDEWLKSAPALALYQPRVAYSYHQNAQGFSGAIVNTVADRLGSVEQWTVNTQRTHRAQ